VRGLKFIKLCANILLGLVALLVSAWIEICVFKVNDYHNKVALLVSAWIEICVFKVNDYHNKVALLVSAWIEIGFKNDLAGIWNKSHSL